MCFSASLLPSYNTLENYFCNLDRQYDFLKFAIALNMEAWDTIVFVSSCNLSVLPFTARWRKRENELFWLRISLASARASSWWDRRREEFYIFMVFFFMRSFFLRQRHLADICSKWSIPLWKIELSDSSICYLRKNVEIFLPHVCRNNSFFPSGSSSRFQRDQFDNKKHFLGHLFNQHYEFSDSSLVQKIDDYVARHRYHRFPISSGIWWL